jgi:AcrR family transcriptional regulator
VTGALQSRYEQRVKARTAIRTNILGAARRVATREGAARLSLRNVALEAGFAPAALYGYFRNKDELMLALAADDLAEMAREMRVASNRNGPAAGPHPAISAVLTFLSKTETLAAATTAMNSRAECRAARLFNGRLIVALSALSAAMGMPVVSRDGQKDVLLMAATLIGLAILVRSRCLEIMGFPPDEVLDRLLRLSDKNSHGN